MAYYKYGRVQYAFPVESISRKLTLRRNTASDKISVATEDGKVKLDKEVSRYIGTGVRSKKVNGIGIVKENYVFVRFNKRSTSLSQEEQASQTYFGNASKLSTKWRKDLTTITTIMQVYNNGYSRKGVESLGKTLRQFVFNVALEVLMDGGTIDSAWPNA